MGSNNPGRYRKEGREAFFDGFTLADCPYDSKNFWGHYEDWKDGWEKANSSNDKQIIKDNLVPEEDSKEKLINDIYALEIDSNVKDILIRIVEMK